jgi:hypothetical protein
MGSPAHGGLLPPSLSDHEPRDGDEEFRMVTGRRPVVESVIAAVAAEQPGVAIRRGVRATELIGGPSAIPGVPHVAGVRTSAGEELRGDLIAAVGDAWACTNPSGGAGSASGSSTPSYSGGSSGVISVTRRASRGPGTPMRSAPSWPPSCAWHCRRTS